MSEEHRWIDTWNERPPEARYGEAGKEPVVSDDVLICFMFPDPKTPWYAVGNYDHEVRGWYIQGISDRDRDEFPDPEGSFWKPLPKPPSPI